MGLRGFIDKYRSSVVWTVIAIGYTCFVVGVIGGVCT